MIKPRFPILKPPLSFPRPEIIRQFCCLLIFSLLFLQPAWPQSPDKQDGAALLARLQAAYAKGDRSLVISPGSYSFPPSCPKFTLDSFHDTTINAYGAVFYLNQGGVVLSHARNLTLRGLTLDNDPAPFMQGVIQAIDSHARTLDIQFDPAYRLPSPSLPAPGQSCIADFFHADGTGPIPMQWESVKSGMQPLGGTLYRVHLLQNRIFNVGDSSNLLVPGDRLAVGVPTGSFGVDVADGENVTLEDVRIYGANGYGIFDHDGKGGNIYRRCVIGRKPGSNRLLALGRDGFHCYRDDHGPLIEYCDFSAAGDDLINIHGFFSVLDQQTAPDTLRIASPFGRDFEAGSTLHFYNLDTSEPLGEARVVSVTKINDPTIARHLQDIPAKWNAAGIHIRDFPTPDAELLTVKLARPINFKTPGVLIDSGEKSGRGAIIRYNHLHNDIGRAALVKASNSLIQGNLMEHLSSAGVAVSEDGYYLEGTFVSNVRIIDNTIIDCGQVSYNDRYMEPFLGSIDIGGTFGRRLFNPPTFHGFKQMRNIEITGNHIIRPAVYGIFANNVRGLKITGNVIESPQQRKEWLPRLDLSGSVLGAGGPPPDPKELEVLRHPQYANLIIGCDTVQISGNKVTNSKISLRGDWAVGPWTSHVTLSP